LQQIPFNLLGQMDRAEFHARQALEDQPEDPDARITLARIASQTGRHAEAAALFDAVGSGGAGHRQGSLHAGQDLMAAGRPLEAMGEFGEAPDGEEDEREAGGSAVVYRVTHAGVLVLADELPPPPLVLATRNER
jgi:predicted Zn-dependent protease